MANAESGEISKTGFNKTQTIKISFWRLDLTFCLYFQGNKCSKLLSATPLAALDTRSSAGCSGWECWSVPPGDETNPQHPAIFLYPCRTHGFHGSFKALGGSGKACVSWHNTGGEGSLPAAFWSKARCVEVSCGVRGGNVFLLNRGRIRQPSLKQSSRWVSNGVFLSAPLLAVTFFHTTSQSGRCAGAKQPLHSSFCRQVIPLYLFYHVVRLSEVVGSCYLEAVCRASAAPGLAWDTAQRDEVKIFKTEALPAPEEAAPAPSSADDFLRVAMESLAHPESALSAQMTHLATKNPSAEIVIKNPILIKPWYWSCHSYFLL